MFVTHDAALMPVQLMMVCISDCDTGPEPVILTLADFECTLSLYLGFGTSLYTAALTCMQCD